MNRLTVALTTAFLLSCAPGLLTAQCSQPQGNQNTQLSVTGLPYTGSTLQLALSGTPLAAFFLLADVSSGPTTIPNVGTFCVGPQPVFLTSTLFHPLLVIPQLGPFTMQLTIPNAPVLAGTSVHFQGLIYDPLASQKWHISNSQSITIVAPGPVTPIYYEGFEGTPTTRGWRVINSVWEMGAPTAGPTAYAGTNVAATILGGNYPANQSARLYNLVPVALPALTPGEELRLVFQEWYSFGGGDWGRIELSNDGAQTWQVVPCNPSESGNGTLYNRRSVDITSFAGQSVNLSFYFSSDCCNGQGLGWYIDEVQILRATPLFINPEGFENGIGQWHSDHGFWQVGTPSSGPGVAQSGTFCAATNLAGNYPANKYSRLIAPRVSLPQTAQFMDFWTWHSFAGGDYGRVTISSDGGCTWTEIGPHITGSGGGVWSLASVNLSAYAGQTVLIGFAFSADCCNGESAGWYIDGVFIW